MNDYISCNKCLRNLPKQNFAKASNTARGYQYKCKSCASKYHAINIEKIKTNKRKYYLLNRDYILKKSLQWQKDNADKVIAKNKAWAERNPEKRLERTQRRRTKLRGNLAYSVTKKELKKLYSSPCAYCKSNEKISIDHVIPIARGGTHSIGNILPACSKCNSSKGAKTIQEWKRGATRR